MGTKYSEIAELLGKKRILSEAKEIPPEKFSAADKKAAKVPQYSTTVSVLKAKQAEADDMARLAEQMLALHDAHIAKHSATLNSGENEHDLKAAHDLREALQRAGRRAGVRQLTSSKDLAPTSKRMVGSVFGNPRKPPEEPQQS